MKRATLVFAFSVLSLLSTYAQTDAAAAPASAPAVTPAVAPVASTTGAIALTGISFEKTEINLGLDSSDFMDRVTLSVKTVPDNATNKDVVWTTSDRTIVRVNVKGTLTPMSVGTATITATSVEGGFKAVCTVHVVETGDRPTLEPKIKTELKGDISTTYGYDLDNGKGAFTRDADVSLIVNVLNQGEAKTSGTTPIWGEIRVYTEGDPLTYGVDDQDSGTDLTKDDDFKIVVDYAKVHFGNAYLTAYDQSYNDWGVADYASTYNRAFTFIKGDTEYRYGPLSVPDVDYLSQTDDDNQNYGIQIGYEKEGLFGVSFDIASTDKWTCVSSGSTTTSTTTSTSGSTTTTTTTTTAMSTTDDTADLSQDATDYAYKFAAKFLYIKDLTVEVGYSNGILGEDSTVLPDICFGGKVDYRWFFNDKYDLYLMPSAGVTLVRQESIGDLHTTASASILLGFDEKADAFDYWGAKYVADGDYGPFPGVALGFRYADAEYAEQSDDYWELSASFNTSNGLLVKNLQAVGAFTIYNALSEERVTGMTLGCVYNWKLPNVVITPKFLVTEYLDNYDSDDSYLFAKAGIVVEPYSNVGFEVNYQSNDLINGFDNGVEYQKAGKIETIVSVKF